MEDNIISNDEIANRNISIDNLRAELVKRDERIDDLITQAASATQVMYQTKADLRNALKHARSIAIRLAEADSDILAEHEVKRAVEALIEFGMAPLKRVFEGELEITVTVPFRVELPLGHDYEEDDIKSLIEDSAALCDVTVEEIIDGDIEINFEQHNTYTDASAWVNETN